MSANTETLHPDGLPIGVYEVTYYRVTDGRLRADAASDPNVSLAYIHRRRAATWRPNEAVRVVCSTMTRVDIPRSGKTTVRHTHVEDGDLSRCDGCGEVVSSLDAGFSPGLHEMGHDCGGTWRPHDGSRG